MAKLKKEAQQAEQPAQTDAPVQGIQDDTATDAPGERVPSAEEVKDRLSGKNRMHFEGLGMPWAVLLGANPANLMSQVIATVLNAGGTRPTWRWQNKDSENNVTDYVLMAWPKEEPVRAAVLVAGPEGDKMHPVDAFPLLQGLPNDLTVAEVHPWKEGHGANVAAQVDEDHSPMWFYDPLYERDRQDLTEGVMQTFLVAGLAFSVRKALLDELTITQGPYYESHAAKWLEENPGKGRLDDPHGWPPSHLPRAQLWRIRAEGQDHAGRGTQARQDARVDPLSGIPLRGASAPDPACLRPQERAQGLRARSRRRDRCLCVAAGPRHRHGRSNPAHAGRP